MASLAFAGHQFRVVGRTALFWPERKALIVADLHLEKASWFAQRGQMLPPYDSLTTLRALAAQIVATGAQEIWCLGDNFHDVGGPERLPEPARSILTDLTRSFVWHWVIGNHDPQLPDDIGGTVIKEGQVENLVFRHQADPNETRPELSGHFHPKHKVLARGRSVSRPCFVRSETRLILPSFGALTGGLAAQHPEILRAAGVGAKALLAVPGRMLEFSLA
jgi:uncharacterized protein